MRTAVCRLPPDATITVQGPEMGRVFRGGDRVDLDALAVPAVGDRPAYTWRDVLGAHVDEAFALEPAAPAVTGPRERRAQAPANEE